MWQRGPWRQRHTEILVDTTRITVHRDHVMRPDGSDGVYDWIQINDQVRVAALIGDDVLLVEQHHYLVGVTWQCPGGDMDTGEDSLTAARRELAEETGWVGGDWTCAGQLFALPAITPARVHLWVARDLTPGLARPEATEADLTVVRVPVPQALAAAQRGAVGCAASAALVLRLSSWLPRPR